MRNFSCILLVAFVVQVQSVFSQIQGQLMEQSLKLTTPFTVTRYSIKEGLPQNQVIKIIKKNDGALILYTANGIVEFDGYSITELIKDKRYKKQFFKSLFYCTDEDELVGLDQNNRIYKLHPDFDELKLSKSGVESIAVGHDSLFALYPDGEIILYNLRTKTEKKSAKLNFPFSKEELTYVKTVLYGSTLYVTTQEGIYSVYLPTKKITRIASGLFSAINQNQFTKKVYAASYEKVLVISGSSIDTILINARLVGNGVALDIEFSDADNFYIASSTGLYAYEYGAFDRYSKKDGLPSENIYSLFVDSLNQCVFAGSSEKGLLKLQYKNNYSYSYREGLPPKSLNSIVKTNDGKVLASYAGGNIYELKSDTALDYISSTGVYASLSVIDDFLYAGTWGEGVQIFSGNKQVDSLVYPANIPNAQVQACFKDSKGNIWIGTGSGVAMGKSPRTIKPVFNEIKETVICIYEQRDGTICLGVTGGAYIIRDRAIIERINLKMGFTGKEVRSFYEDDEGKLWIGSYNGGLYCYNKGKLTSINKIKNCLLDVDAFSLAKDEYGMLYMSSNHGLWSVAEKDLNDFYYKKIDYLIPFHYSEETGILNTEFNGGFQNNYQQTKRSHIYFPSIEGIVMLLPEKQPFKKLIPKIGEIHVNDTLTEKNAGVLGRETHSILINFSCVNFSSKNNIYFQHKLIGEKPYEWSTPQKTSSVYLKMLPPGKYTFLVRAIDGFNDHSPIFAQYQFEILPYFYETLWFRIPFIIVIFLLTFTIVFLRIRVVRKKQLEKERVKRRIAELELNVLLAQMNPHFIFNSLNSLKYFLNTNDIKRADEFIDHFSFLLRKVMIYSSERFISLADEIAMLEAYIELEKIRLNDRFSYKIEIDSAIIEKLIPTFIIQPFVENAIKHGFVNSTESCNLNILFKHVNNTICCIIDDDGIGREKAKELKINFLAHESKGISNVLERIAIKKDSYGKEISIEIIDKKDYEGQARGTMVIINIEEINDTNNYN